MASIHKDPFDRLPVAQARFEPMILLTDDGVLGGHVARLLGNARCFGCKNERSDTSLSTHWRLHYLAVRNLNRCMRPGGAWRAILYGSNCHKVARTQLSIQPPPCP